jgi:tetratricopeptide (TPR) repeat protein
MRPVARFVPNVRVLGALGALVLAVGVALPAVAAVPKEELSDLEAKAQYAFFTEDLNALRGLARANRTLAESEIPLELYHYAHVQFRLLQVASRGKKALKKEADAAGSACVDALDRAVEKDARFAEGLALQGDCYAYLAALGPVNAVTAAPKSAARLEAAAKLNARNPRVMLSQAIAAWERGTGGDPKAEAAKFVAAFRQAAAAFDEPDAGRPGEPTWGAAEAWLFVGRALERQGDTFGARDAYEKALLVAPEFAQARRRLSGLTRR